ncbi:hypothetical protein PSTG_00426 [Puccinia striiformis f. sp. tritici PST-78]|uniref:Uncharacterized protein n=1 Tax=Puccinia striiformis f. sp. tritici PST-78 TaxID=1165861 RepID=A0A0L0W520_9BASI|nr:hypothetical protein PSTG_00426 [Puccinia striiformis f. sp. tritici PST-78]
MQHVQQTNAQANIQFAKTCGGLSTQTLRRLWESKPCKSQDHSDTLSEYQVNQLCALWCAEADHPFSALSDESHKRILHPAIVKHLPSAKVVFRLIHMIYTAVQGNYRKVLKKHTGAMYLGDNAWQSTNGVVILQSPSNNQ